MCIRDRFMDVTDYLNTYKLSAHDLAMKIILDVLETTGITATAGTVSYTHLDVYKRQDVCFSVLCSPFCFSHSCSLIPVYAGKIGRAHV